MREKVGKKRIFVLLALASVGIIAAGTVLFVLLDLHRYSAVAVAVSMIAAVLLVLFAALCVFAVTALSYFIVTKRPAGALGRFLIRVVTRLYPIIIWLGNQLHISSDRIRGSFVEINNQLVDAGKKPIPPERILVLLPHCLQNVECGRKITGNIENCIACGRCDIGDIRDLCDEMKVHAVVATGGTLARKAAKEVRPLAAVACACERDLFHGILDVAPLPIIGVVNERPEGPCHNTRVDVGQLRMALEMLTTGEKRELETV